jgi:GTPase SAR1 family protein
MTTPPEGTKPQYIFKVPVAGDGAVGKTSLIVRYTQGTFSDTYRMTFA